MFKPLGMSEVSIFVMNNDLKQVTDLLYDLKFIEFFKKDVEKFDNFEHQNLNELSGDLLKLRSAIAVLHEYYSGDSGKYEENALEMTHDLKKKETDLIKKIGKLEEAIEREEILHKLGIDRDDIKSKKYLIGFVDLKEENKLKNFSREKIKFKKYRKKERVYFAAETKKISFKFKEFYIPDKFEKNISEELLKNKKELENTKKNLKNLANSSLKHLQKEEFHVSREVSTFEEKTKFLKTSNMCVMTGFVPKVETKKLEMSLNKILGDRYEMEVKPAKGDVPTKLSNGVISGNFESLIKMYSIPRYNEIDPTFLMLLVFPIFYGFILGDAGYGLTSLIIFTLAKMKFKSISGFISILQLSSISAIFFGFLYGEFFGFKPYYILSRAEMPETLLLIALIFGLIHINLGLFVGFLNDLNNHSLTHAIYHKLSWMVLQLGVGALAFGIYVSEEIILGLGIGILLAAFVLLYLGHGFIGIIEIPTFFTNILSYSRLMAFGLSKVAIAMLINQYSAVMIGMGIAGIIGAIILFTIGHTFNIVVGNFASFLHTLRLHYVEFFTKFYNGGGREFVPFGERIHENSK